MLTVVISGEAGEGKSTIAAVVATALGGYDVNVVVEDNDDPPYDAGSLTRDWERMTRRLSAISRRLRDDGTHVVVRTVQVNAPLRFNPPETSPASVPFRVLPPKDQNAPPPRNPLSCLTPSLVLYTADGRMLSPEQALADGFVPDGGLWVKPDAAP